MTLGGVFLGVKNNSKNFDESAVKPCLDLAKKWQDWKQSEDLINGKPLSNETLEKMDEVHKIDEEEHQQVRDLYYRIAMKAKTLGSGNKIHKS